jgi:hypothetical protein
MYTLIILCKLNAQFNNNHLIEHSTKVIVKIKGKPCSLFSNTCTIIGKLMPIIIYIEGKPVDDVLVNSHHDHGSSFCPCILH